MGWENELSFGFKQGNLHLRLIGHERKGIAHVQITENVKARLTYYNPLPVKLTNVVVQIDDATGDREIKLMNVAPKGRVSKVFNVPLLSTGRKSIDISLDAEEITSIGENADVEFEVV